jgi:hypothetical protein
MADKSITPFIRVTITQHWAEETPHRPWERLRDEPDEKGDTYGYTDTTITHMCERTILLQEMPADEGFDVKDVIAAVNGLALEKKNDDTT